MTNLSPLEILNKTSDAACVKASGGSIKLFVLAILAGAYIAFGAQGSLMASFNLLANPGTIGLGKLVMGAVFPVGLMLVVLCGAELFTGNCLMVTGVLDKRISIPAMIRNWVIVYVGNFVGSMLIVYCIYVGGLWDTADGLLGAVTIKTAIGKCGLSFGKAFALGILCNVLVCLAVWMATGAGHTVAKIFAIWFCIWVFVISGFEHSVANMYFIPAGLLAATNEGYLQVLGLDPANLTIYGFAVKNLIPVTLGNIVGGGLVGLAYWFAYRKN